jgi:hypothetical protein
MPSVAAGDIGDVVLVRMHHRAGVEGGDLVVVEVGGDEGLRGEAAGDRRTWSRRCRARRAARGRAGVVADGGHDQRLAAEQLEVVGDVAGAAAELAPHLGHQEGHVQDVHLLGQDVVLEAVLEHHDGVVGDRAADERASSSKFKPIVL